MRSKYEDLARQRVKEHKGNTGVVNPPVPKCAYRWTKHLGQDLTVSLTAENKAILSRWMEKCRAEIVEERLRTA
jgi:hypothetical protein